MGAGRGQVRSRGPQVRIESGVFRLVRGLGGSALPTAAEAAAVAVHLQYMHVVGEAVQQGSPVRRSEPNTSVHSSKGRLVVTRMEPRSQRWVKTSKSSSAPVGDRGTKPSSSMISRPRRDRFRCRVSSHLSSRAFSGPLYLVVTGATPRRGSPAGVLRCHGAAGPPDLPHGHGVWSASPGQPHPAALAGNSPVYGPGWEFPLVVAQGVAGKPGLFLPGRTVYFCPFQPGVQQNDALRCRDSCPRGRTGDGPFPACTGWPWPRCWTCLSMSRILPYPVAQKAPGVGGTGLPAGLG